VDEDVLSAFFRRHMFELVGSGRGIDAVEGHLLLYVAHIDQCVLESVSRYLQETNEGIVDGKSMPDHRPANCR
jgi:hypothetical protein